MNKEDIYDHLAQVYLGKRKKSDEKKKKQFNVWLMFNVLIMGIIFFSVSYGLSAFLTGKRDNFKSNIIYSLHQGIVRVNYNFKNSLHPEESFALNIPDINIGKYNFLQFSIRGKGEGSPGTVKIVVHNIKGESSAYYLQGVGLQWQKISIPLKEFKQITDWSTVSDISFVLESWNVDYKEGLILVDDILLNGTNT